MAQQRQAAAAAAEAVGGHAMRLAAVVQCPRQVITCKDADRPCKRLQAQDRTTWQMPKQGVRLCGRQFHNSRIATACTMGR